MFLSTIKLPGARLLQFATSRHEADAPLAAKEFESLLRRERSLADRGSRVFTLLVLRRVRGHPEDFERLGRRLRRRLRETDPVGRLDEHRLGILLTDTPPDGAALVAHWVDRALEALNLQVERKIYVYPSRSDVGSFTNGNVSAGEDGNSTGSVPSAETTPARADEPPVEVDSVDLDSEEAPPLPSEAALDRSRASSAWSVEDLWVQLVEPLPLWKRSIDIVGSGAGLVALSPVFLAVAVAIKLDSPGPVFYCQTRMGRGRKPFDFYKFRSMLEGADELLQNLADANEARGSPVFKIRNDPRMTRVGRWIRRWSIDELPQLWNVFRGDFSLVGPRPPIPHEVDAYDRWQKRRLDVSGGLTCIWQVSGRSEISFEDWMRMDMRYIARKSMWMDAKLLLRTFKAVFSGRGAY